MTATNQNNLRAQLCQALIAAGKTDAISIIGEVTTLEQFILNQKATSAVQSTEVTQPTAEAKAKVAAEKAVSKAVEETAPTAPVVEETEQKIEISVSFDEVKGALMQVAKRNRDKLIEILTKFGTDKVTGIKECDYKSVINLAEEFLGVAHA